MNQTILVYEVKFGTMEEKCYCIKVKIENMESKSKKNVAYTVLDIKGKSDGLTEKFKAIDAVLGVRIIK